jgi:hypothetical protein
MAPGIAAVADQMIIAVTWIAGDHPSFFQRHSPSGRYILFCYGNRPNFVVIVLHVATHNSNALPGLKCSAAGKFQESLAQAVQHIVMSRRLGFVLRSHYVAAR